MRIVDFHAFPDQAQLREELVQAVLDVDLGDGTQTTPIDDAAPLAIGYPDDFDDETVRGRAEDVRTRLAALVSERVEVRFELADPDTTSEDGGAPTHVE